MAKVYHVTGQFRSSLQEVFLKKAVLKFARNQKRENLSEVLLKYLWKSYSFKN